jgi:hypothetical protein
MALDLMRFDALTRQVTALRALAEDAVAWLDSYYHEGRVAAQSRYRARLAAIGGGDNG